MTIAAVYATGGAVFWRFGNSDFQASLAVLMLRGKVSSAAEADETLPQNTNTASEV